MAEFEALAAGGTEAQFQQFLSQLFAQSGTAMVAQTGVLGSGLGVTQTVTASGAVLVAPGMAVAQDTVTSGATPLINNTVKTVDILTANPASANPRNDIVVFDAATTSVRAITGTPNATPTDPTVPATAVRLARLRILGSATTIPTAQIDDLRTYTSLRRPPAVVADYSRGAGSAIIRASWVKLAFTVPREVSGITYSVGDFAVPVSGRYACRFQVMFPGAAGLASVGAMILVNGVQVGYAYNQGGVGGNWSAGVSLSRRLVAGDLVSFAARHDATASLATVADDAATYAQVELVSA